MSFMEGRAPESEHLGPEELRAALTGTLPEKMVHLRECQACAALVRRMRISSVTFGRLDDKCIELADLVVIAAGQRSARIDELRHLSECGTCAEMMKSLLADLSDEAPGLPPELRSFSQDWQSAMGRQMAAASRPASRLSGFRLKPLTSKIWISISAAAAVLILITLGAFLLRIRAHASDPERLLAAAYTQDRELETRIVGAAFSPLRLQRGAQEHVDRSSALLQVEAITAQKLQTSPNDAYWLAIRGRAALLEWSYDAAIRDLTRSLDERPGQHDVMVDLASAYFERGEAEHHTADFARSIELLSEALERNPRAPVALFNRALVTERLMLYQQSVKDWQDYLEIDPTGPWSDEGRHRLEEIQQKLREHSRLSEERLLPASLVAQSGSTQDAMARVDSRFEEYLGLAVADWLPRARGGSPDASQYERALEVLASLQVAVHHDNWLQTALTSTPNKRNSGFLRLSEAAKESSEGNFSFAIVKARDAEKIFHNDGNKAGEARAYFEEAYASQLSDRAANCLRAISNLPKNVDFRWIRTQALLSGSVCRMMLGDAEGGRIATAQGLRAAEEARYTTLKMRALVFAGFSDDDRRDLDAAWDECSSALSEFWNGHGSITAAHNAYSLMDWIAEHGEEPHVQLLALEEAVSTLRNSDDLLNKAFEHHRLALVALRLHKLRTAEQHFTVSDSLIAESADSTTALANRTEDQVELAKLENDLGDHSGAEVRLSEIAEFAERSQNDFIRSEYWRARGEVYGSRGLYAEAKHALLQALSLSETRPSHAADSGFTQPNQIEILYRLLLKLELEQQHWKDALRIWQRFRNLQFSKHDLQPLTPALLGPLPGTIGLTVVHVGDKVASWVFDGSSITGFTLHDEKEVIPVFRSFRRVCADSSTNFTEIRRLGEQVFHLLLSPQNNLSRYSTIVFDEDDSLPSIPLQAVVDENGSFLLEKHWILHSPVAELLDTDHQPWSPATTLMTVLASQTSDPTIGAEPLPDVLAEAFDIAARFPHSKVLEDKHFQVEDIARDSTIIHFVGHATLHNGRPALLLSGETHDEIQYLNPADLVRQSRHLRLLVLSACPPGAETLANASAIDLLAEGAHQVVVSQWQVDSTATGLLMHKFYDELCSGLVAEQALGQAELELLHDSKYRHPRYWAGFNVFVRS